MTETEAAFIRENYKTMLNAELKQELAKMGFERSERSIKNWLSGEKLRRPAIRKKREITEEQKQWLRDNGGLKNRDDLEAGFRGLGVKISKKRFLELVAELELPAMSTRGTQERSNRTSYRLTDNEVAMEMRAFGYRPSMQEEARA